MPKIVIERYNAGRYASNTAVESSYLKALQMTGTVPAPGSAGSNQLATNNLSPETLQAVGQAVAGQNSGGSVIKPGSKAGTGAKDTPLYVVIEESWGATVLKWVKTLLWVGIAGYFLLVVLTMVVELTGSFRTGRPGANNEVQPQQQTVRFSDVHGVDEAKDELQELAVDPVSAANIRDILTQYARNGGTVIVSSHVMDLVQRMCDHVAVVSAGRVLAAGTVDDVRDGATLEDRFVQLVGGRHTSEEPEWLRRS
jgi:hypothetical protein